MSIAQMRGLLRYRISLSQVLILFGFVAVLSMVKNYNQAQPPGVILDKRQIEIIENQDGNQLTGKTPAIFSERPHILRPITMVHRSSLGGVLFNDKGIVKNITQDIQTALVYSFSPDIEITAKKKFVDPLYENVFFPLSPSVTWFEGGLVLVSRLYLYPNHKGRKKWPANRFYDNYLITQKFDANMNPITKGHIIGIPTPKQTDVGDGPIDPRLFSLHDKLYFTFNSCMKISKKGGYVDFPVMWNLEDDTPTYLKISDGRPKQVGGDNRYEKNWVAIIIKNQLHFIHMLDPLRVLKCEEGSGKCHFIHKEDSTVTQRKRLHLRGGTPFELFEWPYFISIAHSTLFRHDNSFLRYYTPHIVVLCVEPFRIVYTSDALQFDTELYKGKSSPVPWLKDDFFFPVGLILEDKDNVYVSGHINDRASVLVKLTGVKNLMETVINEDKEQNTKKGPPVNKVQDFIFKSVSRTSKKRFKSG